MKTFTITVFLIMYLGSNLTSTYAAERVILIAGDQWCPYVCDKDGDHGFSVELIEKVLKQNYLKTKYLNSNFIRLISQIKKGKWDVVTGTDKNFSPGLLISKIPVAYTKWVFITRKHQKWKYEGTKSLTGLKLGTVAGYIYSKELTSYIEKNKDTKKVNIVYSYSPQESNLRMLLSGKIDVFIGDETVINYWIKKNKHSKSDFKVSGIDFETPLYCGLNKKDQVLSDIIDQGIIRFSKTENFKKLLKKYNIQNWKF
jgi:polar amino acid transport system substrate-binding protein